MKARSTPNRGEFLYLVSNRVNLPASEVICNTLFPRFDWAMLRISVNNFLFVKTVDFLCSLCARIVFIATSSQRCSVDWFLISKVTAMKVITRPTVAALLLLIALTTTNFAQQKRQTPAKPQPRSAIPAPPPTFDTLIPLEGYTMYGEVRGVGQLVRSSALNDALDPVLKLAGPPKEFKKIVRWLDQHAEEVMTSRLLVATWATDKSLPEAIIAIEFANADEAAKFSTGLNTVLKSVLPPTAQPAPEGEGENKKTAAPPKPSYYMQQAGTLILLTPTPLNLKKLKPAGSKLLTDDPNFRVARTRFNSEPIFVFINMKLMERGEEERRKQYETELQQEQIVAVAPAKKKAEEPESEQPSEDHFVLTEQRRELVLGNAPDGSLKEAPAPDPISMALTSIGSSFFEGQSKWPDGIAFALTFENDSFDLRALLF